MESPPSSSTWSEAFILSDDSGLLLTNGSASSGSVSGDGKIRRKYIAFEDSDCEKSLSQDDDSLDGMSDIMCGENFNTLKKGPQILTTKHSSSPIEPPPEFQDKPKYPLVEIFYEKITNQIIRRALYEYKENFSHKLRIPNYRSLHYILARPCISNEFMPLSPCHIVGRPSSRSSLGSSRLSSSHNSLSVPTAHRLDDSTFITQAVSHDALSAGFISDLYNVPFDSDVYAVPVDTVRPPLKPKRNFHQHKKKRRNTASGCRELETRQSRVMASKRNIVRLETNETKRHSVAGTSAAPQGEPIHMTLQEVRQYLQTLYSSSSESSDHQDKSYKQKTAVLVTNNNKYSFTNSDLNVNKQMISNNNNIIINNNKRSKRNTFLINIKNKKVKDSCDNLGSKQINNTATQKEEIRKKSPAKLLSFKQALCNLFKFKKIFSPESIKGEDNEKRYGSNGSILDETHNSISSRALPPLPKTEENENENDEQILDFATSIQRVKDYGWYWGPITSEAAEKILSNEPDGSFIVRDSSDDHYIFSLTFKLNNCVRHVRIEHDQGNFSFGSCTKFKSQTIVEFIENAVEHSRSGRYLFFLHRRPVIGPVRVQLLHPVSRFKQVQSLQHICRFVIHKHLRRDLIPSLPLPRRLIDYLNTPHYYSEHFLDVSDSSEEQQQLLSERGNQSPFENYNNVSAPINNYVVMNNANSEVGQS